MAFKAFPPPPVRGKVPRKEYLVKTVCEGCNWWEVACAGNRDVLSKVPRREPIENKCEWFQAKVKRKVPHWT